MERLYNHVGDFGMIANDTGYAVAHSHCFRIRERLLRLNKRLTGNRLLRGGIVPGGVGHDLPADLDLPARGGGRAAGTSTRSSALTLANTLVMDRLEGTGRLTHRIARDHGVLGYVARASGIDVDVAPRSSLRGLRRAGRSGCRSSSPVTSRRARSCASRRRASRSRLIRQAVDAAARGAAGRAARAAAAPSSPRSGWSKAGGAASSTG